MKKEILYFGIWLLILLLLFVWIVLNPRVDRSIQAIRMNETTVQIVYTPSKPVYVTCYSNDDLLECIDAPEYGKISYTTQHITNEYLVKIYYQDGSIEEKRISVQVP